MMQQAQPASRNMTDVPRKHWVVLACVALALLLMPGCKETKPTCERALKNLTKLIEEDVPDFTEKQWEQMIKVCKETLSKEAKACIMDANTKGEARGCEGLESYFDDLQKYVEALTRETMRDLVYKAYPRWALDNAGGCPGDLSELAQYTDGRTEDAWNNPLLMVCGDEAPPKADGFGVVSVGRDGQQGTADDLKSWEQ